MGRFRLSVVTALTVASLLLGGTALNALADGHGNGNGRGHNVEHTDARHQDRHDDDVVNGPDQETGEVRPGKGCGDQNHEHERHDECRDHGHGHDDDD